MVAPATGGRAVSRSGLQMPLISLGHVGSWALVIIPATALAARSLVRAADPTGTARAVVRTERLAGMMD